MGIRDVAKKYVEAENMQDTEIAPIKRNTEIAPIKRNTEIAVKNKLGQIANSPPHIEDLQPIINRSQNVARKKR